VWDGIPRLHRVAAEILRARVTSPEELELASILCRRWFIALVGRPLEPGLQVDTTLIIQGHQGVGKSSFFRIIAGPWFSDSDMTLDKDGMMQISGVWIYEWAELETVMGRNTSSKVKAFLTSTSDRFRPPFGRTPVTVKRAGVIVGSTNFQDFLSDPTGSRRFWVVPSGEINLPLLRDWREQLLAEAVHLRRQGEHHWLDESEEARRVEFASLFTDTDPWDERLLSYAKSRDHVRITELLSSALNKPVEQQTRSDQYRVTSILRRAGFEPKQARIDQQKQRIWITPQKLKIGTGGTA
jgi:predicted P-loop ATPase